MNFVNALEFSKKNVNNRIIMHIDLDAFFAACEEARDSSLKGKPVIIGSDPKEGKGRGVVSTCNYVARKYGIRSALPISWAYNRCKFGIFLPVDFKLYGEVSSRIFDFISGLGYKFEQAGIDEAYLDISGISEKEVEKVVSEIRKFILKKEKLTCSIGIGPSKLIAKIGSEFRKPNGVTIVNPNEVEMFLESLNVEKIPGIGPKTTERLNKLGVKKISDLIEMEEIDLVEKFGDSWGRWLFRISRGIDNREIGTYRERKSIGAERTFMEDTDDLKKINEKIKTLIEKIFKKMKERKFSSKTIVLKIRYEDFETHTVQKTSKDEYSKLKAVKVSKILLEPYFKEKRKIRLIGVRFSNLEIEEQKVIFPKSH